MKLFFLCFLFISWVCYAGDVNTWECIGADGVFDFIYDKLVNFVKVPPNEAGVFKTVIINLSKRDTWSQCRLGFPEFDHRKQEVGTQNMLDHFVVGKAGKKYGHVCTRKQIEILNAGINNFGGQVIVLEEVNKDIGDVYVSLDFAPGESVDFLDSIAALFERILSGITACKIVAKKDGNSMGSISINISCASFQFDKIGMYKIANGSEFVGAKLLIRENREDRKYYITSVAPVINFVEG